LSPSEFNEGKYNFLIDLLNSELNLILSIIYLIIFLIIIISLILLKYEPNKVEYIKNKIDKISFLYLDKILNYILEQMLSGSKKFNILWMYLTLILLLILSISMYVGIEKCIGVL